MTGVTFSFSLIFTSGPSYLPMPPKMSLNSSVNCFIFSALAFLCFSDPSVASDLTSWSLIILILLTPSSSFPLGATSSTSPLRLIFTMPSLMASPFPSRELSLSESFTKT